MSVFVGVLVLICCALQVLCMFMCLCVCLWGGGGGSMLDTTLEIRNADFHPPPPLSLPPLLSPPHPPPLPPPSHFSLCQLAEKIFLKARDERLSGDEENSYILFMRFLDVANTLKKSDEYKSNKVCCRGGELCPTER